MHRYPVALFALSMSALGFQTVGVVLGSAAAVLMHRAARDRRRGSVAT
ncbi:hypothetical protein [Streptomyces sp. SD15]